MKLTLKILSSLPLVFCEAASIEEMTLEEKVGQLFVVSFKGEQVNEDAKTLIQKIGVGGVIYYTWANGLSSVAQVSQLSSDLQNMAKVPLLIFADQEGGIVSRLRGEEFTLFPGNKALAMTHEPFLARQSALAIGKELRSVGVNGNLAPVVDVNSNPKNPIIGIRSFGEDPQTVVSFAEQALEGYQEAGVISCIKHFPGHGDVEVDSHIGLPVLAKTKEELEKVELVPFAKLAKKTDMVMTAHLMVPSIDVKHCATTSKPILDILRKQIGFDGVVIADSLTMEGVLKNSGSLEQSAVDAFKAGCDILLLGGKKLVGNVDDEISIEEVTSVYQRILQAVQKGEISEDRLNEAVARILALKNKYQIQDLTHSKTNTSKELAHKIAALALETLQKKPSPVPSQIAVVAPSLTRAAVETLPSRLGSKQVETLFFTGLAPTAEEQEKAEEIAKKADAVFFFSYNAWKNKAQEELLARILKLDKSITLIVLRDALDERLADSVHRIIKTSSPTAPSVEAACDKLVELSFN